MIDLAPTRPLRVAVLVKQVPVFEDLELRADGRLAREEVGREMDAYGRRAAALGVAVAQASGGHVTAFTMGPTAARDVLRECLAGGVTDAVHLCDDAFAGSDSLATARALAAALDARGPFDLVLTGRAAVDADTGQVPPQIAQLLEMRFAGGCRSFALAGDELRLGLEHDSRWLEVALHLPAVVTCAERLCDPLKLRDPAQWADISESRIETVSAAALGPGPWGATGSPTTVDSVSPVLSARAARLLQGDVHEAVRAAVEILVQRRSLQRVPRQFAAAVPARGDAESTEARPLAVVLESGEERSAAELLGAAATLAVARPGQVVAMVAREDQLESLAALGSLGADTVCSWAQGVEPSLVASGLAHWLQQHEPWGVLLGGTDWGREVGARAAAAVGAGMTADAIALAVDEQHRLVARKAAFGGGVEAVITCRSPVHVVSVRRGVLPLLHPRSGAPAKRGEPLSIPESAPRGTGVVVVEQQMQDDAAWLMADRVLGIGRGVAPEELHQLDELKALLGAQLAATRKVTDAGWLPRARQVGVTGHAIAPELYVAIGIGGSVTHTAGVRRAGTVLAINNDPEAQIFSAADVGIVADWREAVPVLVQELRRHL